MTLAHLACPRNARSLAGVPLLLVGVPLLLVGVSLLLVGVLLVGVPLLLVVPAAVLARHRSISKAVEASLK